MSRLALRGRFGAYTFGRADKNAVTSGKGLGHPVRNLIHFTLYLGWIDHASDDKSAAEEETTHEL